MNTKKCKYCKSDIDAKAKICPNCKKKQSSIVGKIILLVILVIIIVAVAGALGGNDEDRQIDFAQNETATYNDVSYSIVNVEKTQGTKEFIKPQEGYEYVKVTIRIENNSDEKISYNALDWQMVNSDGVEDAWGSITADDDNLLNSGELDAGGHIEGVLVWEQKIGDDNLRLRYYENSLINDEYTIQFQLD